MTMVLQWFIAFLLLSLCFASFIVITFSKLISLKIALLAQFVLQDFLMGTIVYAWENQINDDSKRYFTMFPLQ